MGVVSGMLGGVAKKFHVIGEIEMLIVDLVGAHIDSASCL